MDLLLQISIRSWRRQLALTDFSESEYCTHSDATKSHSIGLPKVSMLKLRNFNYQTQTEPSLDNEKSSADTNTPYETKTSELDEKAQVPKSAQSSHNTDYPDYGGRNNIVYSAPYSKTHIINKHSKESLKVFPLSQINTQDDGDNSVENIEKVAAAAASSSDTKVPDTTHEHIEEGEDKVMLVTPSYQLLANNSSNNNNNNNYNNSYEVLTEELTLHDIHNFTYEGFNLVDLYRNMLDRKKINI